MRSLLGCAVLAMCAAGYAEPVPVWDLAKDAFAATTGGSSGWTGAS
jgi:hypothetical protein